MTSTLKIMRQIIDQLDNIDDAWNELVDAIMLRGLEHQGFANWETWAVWQWLHAESERLAHYIEAFSYHLGEDVKIEHYFIDAIPSMPQDSIYRTLLTSSIKGVD